MTLDALLVLARKHLGSGSMESSARLCLADAVAMNNIDDGEAAARWALKSLAYSVGIGHPDYQRATLAFGKAATAPPIEINKQFLDVLSGPDWGDFDN